MLQILEKETVETMCVRVCGSGKFDGASLLRSCIMSHPRSSTFLGQDYRPKCMQAIAYVFFFLAASRSTYGYPCTEAHQNVQADHQLFLEQLSIQRASRSVYVYRCLVITRTRKVKPRVQRRRNNRTCGSCG